MKEHYVPQSYLANFSDNRGQIWVFDKSTRTPFKTHIKNIACENDFYNIAVDSPDEPIAPLFVETHLSSVEGTFLEIIREVVSTVDKKGVFDTSYKEALALLLWIQQLRTRESRTYQVDVTDKMIEATQDWISKAQLPEGKEVKLPDELEIPDETLSQVRMMFNQDFGREAVSVYLNEYIWTIGVNSKNMPLYTSDHPVVKDRRHKDPMIREIAFPLTPTHILVLTHQASLKNPEEFRDQIFPINTKGMNHFNSRQIFQCYRHIYCACKKFSFVRHISNKWPDWCDHDRPRVSEPIFIEQSDGMIIGTEMLFYPEDCPY